MAVDLSPAIRAAIVGSSVAALLPTYAGSVAVFTRTPVPSDAPPTVIVVGPDITHSDQDGLADDCPIVLRDVRIYGPNDTAAHYREVETIAYAVRDLFHRKRGAITVAGWGVQAITALGPIPAPVDDEQTVGRVVSLTIEMAKA